MQTGTKVRVLRSSNSKYSDEYLKVFRVKGGKADLKKGKEVVVYGMSVEHLKLA